MVQNFFQFVLKVYNFMAHDPLLRFGNKSIKERSRADAACNLCVIPCTYNTNISGTIIGRSISRYVSYCIMYIQCTYHGTYINRWDMVTESHMEIKVILKMLQESVFLDKG